MRLQLDYVSQGGRLYHIDSLRVLISIWQICHFLFCLIRLCFFVLFNQSFLIQVSFKQIQMPLEASLLDLLCGQTSQMPCDSPQPQPAVRATTRPSLSVARYLQVTLALTLV